MDKLKTEEIHEVETENKTDSANYKLLSPETEQTNEKEYAKPDNPNESEESSKVYIKSKKDIKDAVPKESSAAGPAGGVPPADVHRTEDTYYSIEASDKVRADGEEKTPPNTIRLKPAALTDSQLPISEENNKHEKNLGNEIAFSPKISLTKYITWLIAAILASCALVVYSISAAGYISKIKISIPAVLLGEVFSSGLSELPKVGGLPVLPQIPNAGIDPRESSPGAVEEETVQEIPKSEPQTDADLPISSVDISCGSENGFEIINETTYEPDLFSLAAADSKIPSVSELYNSFGKDAPLVLILHTHGSESYSPDNAESYSSSDSFRSLKAEETVVAVGKAMTKKLNSLGINTIHCTTMFDVEDYNSAYSKAASEIVKYLKEYPSINYVFDVHRDALITSDGENLRPVTDTDSKRAAQLMLVIGTDYGGSDHTEWQDNLSFAAKIQSGAHSSYPTLMRAINLRAPSFNEQYAKGSLLIEVGAAANSLNEAVYSGELISEVIADIIKGNK